MIVDLVNVANMEINKRHLIAYSILGVLVALFFGITIHQCSNPKVKYITSPPERIHDTIIRDSIQIQEKIVTRYITKDQIKFDTIVQIDSVFDTLTIYVPIPIEHKSYRDFQLTDTAQWELGINYSGYKPSLDSVWFNYSYIPKEVVKTKERGFGQHIGIGLQVGYGIGIDPIQHTVHPMPTISVGISYGWGYHW